MPNNKIPPDVQEAIDEYKEVFKKVYNEEITTWTYNHSTGLISIGNLYAISLSRLIRMTERIKLQGDI